MSFRTLPAAVLTLAGALPAAAQCPPELLFDPVGEQQDALGLSVAYDGTTLVAGGGDDGFAGKVLIWRRVEGEFVLEATLAAVDGSPSAPGDDLGRHVAVSGDRLAITTGRSTDPAGRIALFERSEGGGSVVWQQMAGWSLPVHPGSHGARLVLSPDVVAFGGATDFPGIGAVYYANLDPGFGSLRTLVGDASFGRSLALAGQRLAVGAPFDGDQGLVRTYTLDADGYFVLDGTVFPPSGTTSPFGYGVAWGELFPVATLFVGMKDEPVLGLVGAGEVWEYHEQLQPFPQPPIWAADEVFRSGAPVENGRFGHDLALHIPVFGTSRLVVGAPAEGDGVLHVFARPLGGSWQSATSVEAPDPGVGGNSVFANLVDLAGSTAVACHSNVDGPAGFDQGAIVVVELNEASCPPPLQADVASISQSMGGVQTLSLDLGPERAGDYYWLFGSASGTEPGIPLSQFVLPLVPDAYFVWSAQHFNGSILVNTFGALDAEGRATAAFAFPPGAPILSFGYFHAAVTFRLDPLVHTATTNAVEVAFTP